MIKYTLWNISIVIKQSHSGLVKAALQATCIKVCNDESLLYPLYISAEDTVDSCNSLITKKHPFHMYLLHSFVSQSVTPMSEYFFPLSFMVYPDSLTTFSRFAVFWNFTTFPVGFPFPLDHVKWVWPKTLKQTIIRLDYSMSMSI